MVLSVRPAGPKVGVARWWLVTHVVQEALLYICLLGLNALQHRVVVVQPLVSLICSMSPFRWCCGLSITGAPQLPSGLGAGCQEIWGPCCQQTAVDLTTAPVQRNTVDASASNSSTGMFMLCNFPCTWGLE